MKFKITKTMVRYKGKFVYMIFNKETDEAVGRIIWDGEKWITDGK